jgi:hypothetical protein
LIEMSYADLPASMGKPHASFESAYDERERARDFKYPGGECARAQTTPWFWLRDRTRMLHLRWAAVT